MVQQVRPYQGLAPVQFQLPTQAFGMPSGGMLIGQFSPAMIRPEGISMEDMLVRKYTRYIERYVSSDAEQYCNDIPALVDKATATLKEKAPQLLDITNMCSTVKKQAEKCKKFAPQICDQMKKQSGCGEDFLSKCKSEMKKYLGQFADSGQVQGQCEQKWNFRAQSCSGISTGACDRSQFVGDCTKKYMNQCRGQEPPPQQQPPQQQPPQQQPPQRVCAQVITPAVAPTGECKNFPTPCDVPGDWKVVNACPVATMIPTTATPGITATPIATATAVETATETAAPTATATATATTTITATPIATEVPATNAPTPEPTPTTTPTTTAQTALRDRLLTFLNLLNPAAAQEGGACSLKDAEELCNGRWEAQSGNANCNRIQQSCDKDKFMQECKGVMTQGTEKMMAEMDAQCNARYEGQKLGIEMMCSEMEDRIDQCNEQSKLACDDLDEEYESCMALAPKKQEKLREAVQNIARDMCQFSKYKPKVLQESMSDISPSETVPVTIAVAGKLSTDQLAQLKKIATEIGEPNQIGKIVLYKVKMKAENFDGLSRLGFVLDAQLDSIRRAIESSDATAAAGTKTTTSSLAPDVPATIAALEAVKQSVSEDFQPLVSAQEGKIADSADTVMKMEEDMGSRGLAYKLKWFLGMGAESEKADSEKLSSEAKNLATSEESLKKIAEQISDLSTKAALLEQASEIGKRREIMEKMSVDKKRNAAGILSFLKIVGG